MGPQLKKNLFTLLKLSFASSIIFYMISTGKLDLNHIYALSKNKLIFLELVITLLLGYALVAYRLYLLLTWQGISISLWSVVRINCIGLFFNSFMPGSVGGDIVRAYYIAKEKKEFRTKAIVTIFIDRFIGLEGLMFVGFAALLFNYDTILSNPHLKALALTISIYILISILAVTAFISKRVKHFFITHGLNKLFDKLPQKELLSKIYGAFHVYSDKKINLLKIIAITLPLDLLIIYIFYLLGRELGDQSMTFGSYLTAVPVGLLLMAIPLTPAGIGVGQGVFYTLFLWFGATSGKIGASVITAYQILTICVNLCFALFYISNKKEINQTLLDAHGQSPLNN